MKRRSVTSDTDNDDDMFDDDEFDNTIGSPSQSCGPDRKRRRGIIEKRRRDRINHSLMELRILVPAAFEKQGATKLEKAEILKMTVDHLKMLQSKGVNGVDTTTIAMDFRSVGFRECASEVARYLVAIEGLDSQDPLRLRLLSHLQYYSLHAASRRSTAPSSVPPLPPPTSCAMMAPPATGCWSLSNVAAATKIGSGHRQYSSMTPSMTPLMTSYPMAGSDVGSSRHQGDLPSSSVSSSFDGVGGRFGSTTNDAMMTSSSHGGYSEGGGRGGGGGGGGGGELLPSSMSSARHFQTSSSNMTMTGVSRGFSDASHMMSQPIMSGLNGPFMYPGTAGGNSAGSYTSMISGLEGCSSGPNSSLSSSSAASALLLQCVRPYRPWGSESLMASLMSTY